MVIVDLQELEDQARMSEDSIAGVVLEPEAILLIVSEIRRLKAQVAAQCNSLDDMKAELLQLHALLTNALALDVHPSRAAAPSAPQKRKSKVFSMRVRPNSSPPSSIRM